MTSEASGVLTDSVPWVEGGWDATALESDPVVSLRDGTPPASTGVVTAALRIGESVPACVRLGERRGVGETLPLATPRVVAEPTAVPVPAPLDAAAIAPAMAGPLESDSLLRLRQVAALIA